MRRAWVRVADAPAVSPYDLWNVEEKNKPEKTSLTHLLRKGTWETLPFDTETPGARTPLGVRVDGLLTDGKLENMPLIGPYKARAEAPIDCGLITRTNRGGNWVCGIFWDRTSHVTDHHPADCLHSIVNIGGMPRGQSVRSEARSTGSKEASPTFSNAGTATGLRIRKAGEPAARRR